MQLRRVAVVGGRCGGPESGGRQRGNEVDAADELARILAGHGIAPVAHGEPADGFIALPGGAQTLRELFAICLDGSPDRPCGLWNLRDYFTDLLKTADDASVARFVRETQRGRLIVERDPALLLRAMAEYSSPETRRRVSQDGP